MTAIQFISDLVARGRYCFSAQEAVSALGATAVAARAALRRLRQKGELAMPYKGFYAIVPPEFRNIGCLPAAHFIPSLVVYKNVVVFWISNRSYTTFSRTKNCILMVDHDDEYAIGRSSREK